MNSPDAAPPLVILLAEDEPADAHLVAAALAGQPVPATLHHVVDGQEVLAFLQRRGPAYASAPRPQLILLDLNMPRMDGRECLAELKKTPAFSDIPVVILTTSDVERDVLGAYQLGAAAYLTKAVDIDRFQADISQLIGGWQRLVGLPQRG